MILYHGGTAIERNPTIRTPATSHTTDFGYGFYTTTSYEQAKTWAVIRRKRDKTEHGYVCYFEAPDGLLQGENLKRLIFKTADKDWLEFVMQNRALPDFIHDYDLVAGPVADDKVYTVLDLFEGGIIDFDSAIRELKTHNLADQILFHTAASLEHLTFIKSEEI